LARVSIEYADITENILVKLPGNINLAAALQDPKILPYFRSLSVRFVITKERKKELIASLLS